MKKRRKSKIIKAKVESTEGRIILWHPGYADVRTYVLCPLYKHYKGLEVCYFKCSKFKRCKRIYDLYVANGYVIAPTKEKDGQIRQKARHKRGATVPEQAGEVSGHEDKPEYVHQSGDAEDV